MSSLEGGSTASAPSEDGLGVGGVVFLLMLWIPGTFIPCTWVCMVSAKTWSDSWWLYRHGHFTLASIQEVKRFAAISGFSRVSQSPVKVLVRLKYTAVTTSINTDCNEEDEAMMIDNPVWFCLPPSLCLSPSLLLNSRGNSPLPIIVHPSNPHALQFMAAFNETWCSSTAVGLLGFLGASFAMLQGFFLVWSLEVPHGQGIAMASLALVCIASIHGCFLHVRAMYRSFPRDGYAPRMDLQEETTELISQI